MADDALQLSEKDLHQWDLLGRFRLRGRVSYFLGHSNTTMISETFRTWGANAIAKSRCDSTNCCISKNDFNLDGFTDALTFSSLTLELTRCCST